MSLFFVGLDMSLSSTGFCVKGPDGVTLETIKTTPKSADNDLERLLLICREVMGRIPANVGMVCIEDYFTPSNSMQIGAAMKLVALGTAMRLALHYVKLPFYVIAAPRLKKFITGKGNSPKSIIVRETFQRWGVNAADDNQADGAGLAYLAEAIWLAKKGESQEGLTKPQLAVVADSLKTAPNYNS